MITQKDVKYIVYISTQENFEGGQIMIPWDEKTVSQSLWDREVGAYVLNCLQHCDTSVLAQQVDSEAVRLLEEIKAIIQDPALDDPECFARIEALTNAFYVHGISTTRHNEYG
jgi:hypothetical protein